MDAIAGHLYTSTVNSSNHNVVPVVMMLMSRDHVFGLGLGLVLTVIGLGLGLGLMKYWSQSHTFWSRGLKSI